MVFIIHTKGLADFEREMSTSPPKEYGALNLYLTAQKLYTKNNTNIFNYRDYRQTDMTEVKKILRRRR